MGFELEESEEGELGKKQSSSLRGFSMRGLSSLLPSIGSKFSETSKEEQLIDLDEEDEDLPIVDDTSNTTKKQSFWGRLTGT